MIQKVLLTVLLAGLSIASAQQGVSREDCLKAAFAVSLDLKQMLNTPIPTDPDLKRPVIVRNGDRGGMVLPESKLSVDGLAKAGKDVIPIGQLWLRGTTLVCAGQPAKPDKLQLVTVGIADQPKVALFALGARKDAAGKMELLIYGKDKEPLTRAPLQGISVTQENPIEMSAEPQGEGALVTLRILGKYEGSFTVAQE
jgi:hypothetical protein